MEEKRFLYDLQNYQDPTFNTGETSKVEQNLYEYLDAMTFEELNLKVKDMIEAFRRQLKEQTECIDKEKSALNQFISGLVKDEKAQSPRKLKAMSFQDLNKRIDELIKGQLQDNESLHKERNQLQIELDQMQEKNTLLDQDLKAKEGELSRSQSQHEQQVNENRELSEDKQKLETLSGDQKKDISKLKDDLMKL